MAKRLSGGGDEDPQEVKKAKWGWISPLLSGVSVSFQQTSTLVFWWLQVGLIFFFFKPLDGYEQKINEQGFLL